MQAQLNPEEMEAMRIANEKLPEKIKGMADNKVLFSEKLMAEALGHKAVDSVKVTRVVPGDVVVIEGKRHLIKRITDKDEWVTEILPDPPAVE